MARKHSGSKAEVGIEGLDLRFGNALDELRKLPDESIDCIVTSPPYWRKRVYGTVPQVWGGVSDCAHIWGAAIPGESKGGSGTPTDKNNRGEDYARGAGMGKFCQSCGAWRGELGLEPTPALFVEHMMLILAECMRVLKKRGTMWLNFGDTYYGDSPTRAKAEENFSGAWDASQTASRGGERRSARAIGGLKPKCLVGIPWRVALACIDAGWWVRSEIIWEKPSAMPESVKDRPSVAHETIFLLSKSKRYYYDADAIRNALANDTLARYGRALKGYDAPGQVPHKGICGPRQNQLFEQPADSEPAQKIPSSWNTEAGGHGFASRAFTGNAPRCEDRRDSEAARKLGKKLAEADDSEVRGARSAAFGRGAGWRQAEKAALLESLPSPYKGSLPGRNGGEEIGRAHV